MTNTNPRPNRAIDRHEDAIVAVLDAVEKYGYTYPEALNVNAFVYDLPAERLDSLVRVWCAIAGIEVPA